jgi:hypothetical protein
MKKLDHVYLILAHKYPNQLKRLISRLYFKNCRFVIHVDGNENIDVFYKSIEELEISNSVSFVADRCCTSWGSFGLVQATLNSLLFIEKYFPETSRVSLLSGQDYPIKPLSFIDDYLNLNKSKIFIGYNNVASIAKDNHSIVTRFPQYENISKQIDLYKGSQWWSFPMSVIRIILDVVKDNYDFVKYFRFVKIPDESFFHTLLLNSGDKIHLSNIVNCNLRFILWEPPFIHPRTFLANDIDSIISHPGLFARKFDEEVDANILDLIDQRILSRDKLTSLTDK